MDGEQQLLTVREVARRCQRSEETVRRWIWSGKLPARKLGNQLFIEASQLPRLQPGVRLSEARWTYRAPASERGARVTQMTYDREEKLRELEDDLEFAEMLHRKYGPVDVTELLREVREEDD